jgi:GntR family transcriptional regulator
MSASREAEGPATISVEELGVAIDRKGEVPIGVQLAWALRSRIGTGELTPGQRLPGLRDLAQASGVNVNTARAVYQRLEQEGLIEAQQGSGTFVAQSQRSSSQVAAIAEKAAQKACERGLDPREVAAALYVFPSPSGTSAEEAAKRGRLREQIGALERALVEIEARHPGVVAAPPPTPGGGGPALLDGAELERVRALLLRRLAALQSAIDELTREEGIDAGESGAKPAGRRASEPQTAQPAPAKPKPRARPAPAGA